MRTLQLLVSLFVLGAITSSVTLAQETAAPIDKMTITDADFKSDDAWGWWSRTDVGSATHVEEGCKTPGAVRIVNDGPRDFAFSNETRIPVAPGQAFKATAWVKPLRGKVELAVVGLKDGKLVDWRIGRGNTSLIKPGEWGQVTAKTVVPDGVDTVYVRFTGDGDVEALVDDIAFEPWNWQGVDKPKVEGFAKERVVEKLDRCLVVRRLGDGKVYLSWRLLDSDPENIGFHVYMNPDGGDSSGFNFFAMTDKPITKTTDFTFRFDDNTVANKSTWRVCPVIDGVEHIAYEFEPTHYNVNEKHGANQPIKTPLASGRTFQKAGIADLDGDGRYDYVLKTPGDNIDPYDKYWKPSPDTYCLEAYGSKGTHWTYDLGWSIERGIWYSPYIVYDFNGDGKAEVVAKTGVGDPRDEDGRVHEGEEFITVLNGETGRPICQAPWPSRDGFDGERGYNYASRNQLGVAYLDGKTPCLIVARGTYNVMKAVAYQLVDGQLEELWAWDNIDLPGNCWGQGAHWMHCADIDDDGRDEVLLGSIVLDDNGSLLWTTGLGHPDHFYLGDIDPDHPGLEIYYGIEPRRQENAMCLVDAATGEILWGHDQPTTHIHASGMCSDIDASRPGLECYSGERDFPEDRWLRDAKGDVIEHPGDFGTISPRTVFWDADPQREVIRGNRIVTYPEGEEVGRFEGKLVQVADVIGDWREEIITSVEGEMHIYSTTIPATDRRPCLMQDPIYRIDTAHGAMGYTQVPMVGEW